MPNYKRKRGWACLFPSSVGDAPGDVPRNSKDAQLAPISDEEKINPFTIAPNAIDENTFKMKNPFVFLRNSLPPFDKVGNPKMNEDALYAAIGKTMMHAQECYGTFKKQKTESNGWILHASFLMGLRCLTRPAYDPTIDNDVSDVQVNMGEDKTVEDGYKSSTSSNESLDIKHEQHDEAPQGKAGAGRSDFKVFVNDHVLRKRKRDVDDDMDSWCSVLAIEVKWNPDDDDAMFQAAEYAVRAARKNFEKGRVAPIYLQVWSRDTWTYAILDVYGYIEINAGNITSESFDGFEEEEKERWKRVIGDEQFQKSSFTKEYLQLRLETTTERLKRNSYFQSYPNGKYLVASLHRSNQEYLLPSFKEEGAGWTVGARLFYEGLLRIVIGDGVGSWTVDDVTRAYDMRKRMAAYEWKRVFGSNIPV